MAKSSMFHADVVKANGGSYVKHRGEWVFKIDPAVRLAAFLRGGTVPPKCVRVDAVAPVDGPPRIGEFKHPGTGVRMAAASIPGWVATLASSGAMSDLPQLPPAMRMANVAGAILNEVLGAGGPRQPAWLVYTLPKVVGGEPVVEVGAKADVASRSQVEAALPGGSQVRYVVNMLTPKTDADEGLSGLGFLDTVTGAVAVISASALTVAGNIGSTFIAADAAKYVAKTQAKADLQIALAKQQAELKAFEAQLAAQQAQAEVARAAEEQATIRTAQRAAATKEIAVSYAPYVGIGAFGLAAVLLILRK